MTDHAKKQKRQFSQPGVKGVYVKILVCGWYITVLVYKWYITKMSKIANSGVQTGICEICKSGIHELYLYSNLCFSVKESNQMNQNPDKQIYRSFFSHQKKILTKIRR